jgi:hypothetical protein
LENVNLVVLEDMGQAAAYTLQHLATLSDLMGVMNVTAPATAEVAHAKRAPRYIDPNHGVGYTI